MEDPAYGFVIPLIEGLNVNINNHQENTKPMTTPGCNINSYEMLQTSHSVWNNLTLYTWIIRMRMHYHRFWIFFLYSFTFLLIEYSSKPESKSLFHIKTNTNTETCFARQFAISVAVLLRPTFLALRLVSEFLYLYVMSPKSRKWRCMSVTV